MRHIVVVNFTNPEGAQEGREYWVAKDEDELELWLMTDFGIYTRVTHLGAVVEPKQFCAQAISTHSQGEST